MPLAQAAPPWGPVHPHGQPPHTVAVLHGGPGAPGSAAGLAHALAADWGVLEPWQSRDTVAGQVAELAGQLTAAGPGPYAVVGWSWGALLGVLFAARHPALVRRLVLVGSGVFTAEAAATIRPERLRRLTAPQRERVAALEATLADPNAPGRNAALRELATLFHRVDHVDPVTDDIGTETVDVALHERVWADFVELRRSGALLAEAGGIACPVVALHGDHDPHPAEGVEAPLRAVLRDFAFHRLAACGHAPWLERQARAPFLRLLRQALTEAPGPDAAG